MLTRQIQSLARFHNASPPPNYGKKLTTTSQYPILYRQITKCGCTFMNNVLRNLDGRDDDHNILATASTNDDIMQATHKFIIIRNPIDRFTSLYFDKIMGEDSKVQRSVLRRGLVDLNAGDNIDTHQENCVRVLRYIKKTLSPTSKHKPNWHWKPQLLRLKQVTPFNFNVVTLEGMIWQLPPLLHDIAPDFAQAMYDVPRRNISKKTVDPKEMIVQEIEDMLIDIYPMDFQIFDEVSAYWDKRKQELVKNGTA
ncbi:hypothetical protein BFP76_09880 [Amylibacter kogurei]|uniref:Sulfotransferase domain-containing protein n=1 Tax=Paramylibacter kogurei TaxID=1889778 RepID=A0A2G5K004_9RHOB|nr:sulfotransferase family 2 domain-containing protein [Amylibacter kogurei]PIB22831.1 hypothetical protein BFP76_09880 [Amylibacter kogurei]